MESKTICLFNLHISESVKPFVATMGLKFRELYFPLPHLSVQKIKVICIQHLRGGDKRLRFLAKYDFAELSI